MFDRKCYRAALGGLVILAQLPLLAAPIDRAALVQRHNPVHHALDVDMPLTVGNSGFAFGADITGLQTLLAKWDWQTKIWGWDYPMIAMTAARLGRPDDALEILLRNGPNNIYLPNGHCPQRVDESATGVRKREIPVYLPANGALLSAVALMVAGWDGCDRKFPGFPAD